MKNSLRGCPEILNKQFGRTLSAFIGIGFISKIITEIIHEVLGHGFFVLLFNGRVTSVEISLFWPLEFSTISFNLPEDITNLELAIIEAGGIISCGFLFFVFLLLLIRIQPERWVSSTLTLWLAFWCLMNSAGYLVIGGLNPFGDVYRLLNMGILTRSISISLGTILFLCGFIVISVELKQLVNRWIGYGIYNSLIVFWSIVPLLTLLTIIGHDFQLVLILPSMLPILIHIIIKLTSEGNSINFLTDEE